MKKVKRIDLLNLWHALEKIKSRKANIKFSYFVAKNRLNLKNEIEAINETQEAPEAFKAFDKERGALAEKYSDKDLNGKAIIKDNQYVITEKRGEFDKELEKIRKKYKKVVEERETQLEKLREFLNEVIDFEGYKIELDNLPPDLEPFLVETLLITDLIKE